MQSTTLGGFWYAKALPESLPSQQQFHSETSFLVETRVFIFEGITVFSFFVGSVWVTWMGPFWTLWVILIFWVELYLKSRDTEFCFAQN